MLTTEERQAMRKLSESISSLLSDEKLERIGQSAHRLAGELRELVGSDDAAAKVADMMASVCASLELVPAGALGSTLDTTGSAYALAAGSLAGVYTLPERKGQPESSDPQLPFETVPADDYLSPGDPSPYL